MIDDTYLNRSVDRYLKNVKFVNNSFVIIGFPVKLDSSFEFNKIINSLHTSSLIIKSLTAYDNIHIYSLQNIIPAYNAREYWNKKTLGLLKTDELKAINIFLFYTGSIFLEESYEKYNQWESTDDDFCHSKMMRDIIYKRRRGFDFDLSLAEVEQDGISVFWKEFNRKISKLDYNESISLNLGLIDQIVNVFNKYFPNAKLQKNIYNEIITDLYSYVLNSQSFNNLTIANPIVEDIRLSDIRTGHELYGSVIKKMKEKDGNYEVSKLSKWLIYLNLLSDLTKLIVHYCELKDKQVKILLIDDKPENISNEINFIKEISEQKIIFENESEKRIIPFEKYDELFNALEIGEKKVSREIIDIYDKIIKGYYELIIIDLDYYGELKGFDYLRKLRKAKTIYSKPYVIVFSRIEDPRSVQKALNMGALFVASKQNVAQLSLELYRVLPLVCKTESETKEYSLGHNWSLLYQLQLNKILGLKSDRIIGENYVPYELKSDVYGFDNEKLIRDREYLWINKLPKAELHCHIGSILGPDLIPQTALLVLAQKYTHKSENIRCIIDFILPVVSDPFLFEQADAVLEENISLFSDYGDYTNSNWHILKSLLIIDKLNQFKHQSIFSIISDSLNLKAHKNKTPEEVLLSPEDETLEKQFIPFSRLRKSNYYKDKLKLRELGIKYDEVILLFILMLNIREKVTEEGRKTGFEESLNEIIEKMWNVYSKSDNRNFIFPQNEVELFKQAILKELGKPEISKKIFIPFYKIRKDSKCILEFLISAHSHQRCLDFHNRGLFNYLRGCEYGGAPHLQSKESIFLVAHHIIYNYAIPDNIRYLDLRCAIDGYNKFKLFKQLKGDNELPVSKLIVDTLKESFTHWQRIAYSETKKKTHVNLIITAKRHKSIKEFEENILITVENYKHPKDNEINKTRSFFDTQSEIVSFDIAGLEKGNRVSRFKEKLDPLLEKCIPITMHAGEEDSHEAIWEAYYLAHAQRIGHALSLKGNEKLINSIRESFVNIELCPISNYLTNLNFSFGSTLGKSEYPLNDYLRKRISVSINTDNPYVSESNLSKEFLFAAKISGGLTKWEILKLILYSFKSITIHKSLKSKLLKEINEEIYELILNEGE